MGNNTVENKKETIETNYLIENIKEVSKISQKIYLLYNGLLLYCVLTLIGTSDRDIVLNTGVHLPILNVNVSLYGFFIIAPLIAIYIFIYLQLYLNRLQGLKYELPKKYALKGKRVLYPWILNIAEDPDSGTIGKLQKNIAKFSLWWTLPVFLILFAFWVVKKHDLILSYIIGAMPILGTFIVLYFSCQYEDIQEKCKYKISNIRRLYIKNTGKIFLISIVLIYFILFNFFIIPCAMEGGRFEFLRHWICIDLSYQKLANEPTVDYKYIPWVFLRDVHLEGANLKGTVLKRADLKNAHLQKAEMSGVNLEEANLWKANLQGVNLFKAVLRGADLAEADLKGSILQEADLRGVINLGVKQLSHAKTLYKTELDLELMDQIKKDYPHLLERPKFN